MREVRPSLLIREGKTLLVRYSLDTRARYFINKFQVSKGLHRGPEFSHNYLIDYTIGFIIITLIAAIVTEGITFIIMLTLVMIM